MSGKYINPLNADGVFIRTRAVRTEICLDFVIRLLCSK